MNQERLLQILVAPHVSEKSTIIGDRYRQFVFQVLPDAEKVEIKQAVEQLFNVEVETVRICRIKGKLKRFGQIRGRRMSLKKAYVTLRPGFDINFAGGH